MTSYPFNRSQPEVYLVVNIDQEKLEGSIHIEDDRILSTALVDHNGGRISQSGTLEIEKNDIGRFTRFKHARTLLLDRSIGSAFFCSVRF